MRATRSNERFESGVWVAAVVVAVFWAASPANAANTQARRLEGQIDRLDKHIGALQTEYTGALSAASRFRAMAAPYHNFNPQLSYARYGSAFPQITLANGIGINEAAPVVKLSEGSRSYRYVAGGLAYTMTWVNCVECRLREAQLRRNQLYTQQRKLFDR